MKRPLIFKKKLLMLMLLIFNLTNGFAQSQNYSNWEIKASDLTDGKLVMVANQTKTITIIVTAVRVLNPNGAPGEYLPVNFNFELHRMYSGALSCGCTPISNVLSITSADFAPGQNFATKEFTVPVQAGSGISPTGNVLRNYDNIRFVTSGPWSPSKAYTVLVNIPPVAPAAPSNLQASNVNVSECTLNWTAPPGIVIEYHIYKDGTYLTYATSNSIVITNLYGNTNYSFTVSAYNYGGESPNSNSVNVLTLPPLTINNYINPPSNYNLYRYSNSVLDIPVLQGSTPYGGAGSYVYKWQKKSYNTGVNWIDIPGATSIDYDPPTIFQTTGYRRIVNSVDVSAPLYVYIYPPIENNTICCNQTVTNPTLANPLIGQNPTGGGPERDFKWESSVDNMNWVTLCCGTLNQYQPSGGQSGITFYRRVISDLAGQNVSNVVQIEFINTIPLGSNFANPIPIGEYTNNECSYFTTTENSLSGSFSNVYGDSRNDLFYSFTVNYTSNIFLLVTTCNSGVDTKISILNSDRNVITSAENGSDLTLGCGQNSQEADFLTSQLYTGQYYLVIEGNGNLKLNIFTALYGDCFDQYIENQNPSMSFSRFSNPLSSSIILYPNPFVDKVSVLGLNSFSAALFDLNTLSWNTVNHKDGIMDLSRLKKGSYIIKIKSKDQTIIKRIIKE